MGDNKKLSQSACSRPQCHNFTMCLWRIPPLQEMIQSKFALLVLLTSFALDITVHATDLTDTDLFHDASDTDVSLSAADWSAGIDQWEANLKITPSASVAQFPFVSTADNLFEGDIRIRKSNSNKNNSQSPTDDRQNAAILDDTAFWPDANIPYVVSGKFREKARRLIAEAMTELHRRTCVRFEPRQNESDYVYFGTSSASCSSDVGRMGGMQEVTLGLADCFEQAGTIVHELMHVLGFYHEQTRFDRDKFVQIHWANIEPTMDKNFQRYDQLQATVLGTPYDYASLLHYPSTAFSRNGQPTIVPRMAGVQIGQRTRMSDFDVFEVREFYKCPGDNPMPKLETFEGEGSTKFCGTEAYNVFIHGCCNETVYALTLFVCCEGKVVEPQVGVDKFGRADGCGTPLQPSSDSVHCNGTKYNWSTHICCQNETYSKQTYVCCEDFPLDRRANPHIHCCGDALMDDRMLSCCNGTGYSDSVFGCCNQQIFDRTTQVCCGLSPAAIPAGSEPGRVSCCSNPRGQVAYDMETHGCCAGTTIYGRLSEVCCGGFLYQRHNTSCCGEDSCTWCDSSDAKLLPYNPQTQGCCLDDDKATGIFEVGSQACCDKKVVQISEVSQPLLNHGRIKCCAGQAYDPQKQVCCNDELSVGNADEVTCCGTVPLITDGALKCCYSGYSGRWPLGLPYDPEVQLCCDKEVTPKHHGEECCKQTTSSVILHCNQEMSLRGICTYHETFQPRSPPSSVFSQSTHHCCSGHVVPRPPNVTDANLRCCGSFRTGYWAAYSRGIHSCCYNWQIYNPAEEFCDGDWLDIAIVWNKFSQHVCSLTVVDVPPDMQSTDLGDYSCCGVKFFNLKMSGCCAGQVYMDQTQICCEGQVQNKSAGQQTECCGAETFNNLVEICCADVISPIPLVPRRQSVYCCGSLPYAEGRQRCCGKERHHITSVIYDRETEKCCLDSPNDPKPIDLDGRDPDLIKCCGGQLYDVSHHRCCDEKHVVDERSQACCNGEVVASPEGHQACCGMTPYSPQESLCCEEQVFDRHAFGLACCGRNVYQRDEQDCCIGDRVCDIS